MRREATPIDYPFQWQWDRSRYSEAWLRLPHDEDLDIVPGVLAALRALGAHVDHVDAGARSIRGRAFGAIRRSGGNPAGVMLGKTGAAPAGFPDVIGTLRNGRTVAIECKAPELLAPGKRSALVQVRAPGLPTPEQLAWLEQAHRRGAIVGVAWCPRDVARILGLGGASGVVGADGMQAADLPPEAVPPRPPEVGVHRRSALDPWLKPRRRGGVIDR